MSHGPTNDVCISYELHSHCAFDLAVPIFCSVCMSHELHSHSWVYVSQSHALYSRSCASQSRPTLCLRVTHYIHIAPSILLCWFYALCIRVKESRTRSHWVIGYGSQGHQQSWCLWFTNYGRQRCWGLWVTNYIHSGVSESRTIFTFLNTCVSESRTVFTFLCLSVTTYIVSLSHELHSHSCRSLTLRAPVLQHCVYQSQATTIGRLIHISLGYQRYLLPLYPWDTNYTFSHPILSSMSRKISISTSHEVYITVSHYVYNLPPYFFMYESRRLHMYESQILQIYESRRRQPPSLRFREAQSIHIYESRSIHIDESIKYEAQSIHIYESRSIHIDESRRVRHKVYTSMSLEVHLWVTTYTASHPIFVSMSHEINISMSDEVYISMWERVREGVCMSRCVFVEVCVFEDTKPIEKGSYRNASMGWLRLVGSLKLQVSFAEYSLFYRAPFNLNHLDFEGKVTEATLRGGYRVAKTHRIP